METLIFAIVFLIAAVVNLYIYVPMYKRYKKTTDNIKNFDDSMRRFVYKVPHTKEEILKILQTVSAADIQDDIECHLCADKTEIVFWKLGRSLDYSLEIREIKGFCIVILTQIPKLKPSNIPYLLNPFMVETLDAEIVPFAIFGR